MPSSPAITRSSTAAAERGFGYSSFFSYRAWRFS
jgi:hypothetical protein